MCALSIRRKLQKHEIIISTFASSVGMCRCAATRAEKISQLIMEMLTGDMFSSVEEGEIFCKLMPEYKLPLQGTTKMHEKSLVSTR